MSGVFVTGAAGFIGRSLVAALAAEPSAQPVTALDLRDVPEAERLPGVTYLAGDIRDVALTGHLLQHRPACVVHLASVVAAGGDEQRDYEIDVKGTENVLR
ncbi:MAG: NAD-dependent epimerase/dehydratase family protein, partial [Ferrovibrio sp.]